MPGEDQERFEDYLELERYIEELQAGHAAHPSGELTPAQARVYRMAALFRSATPGADEPSPEFVAELQARLEQELEQSQQTLKMRNPLLVYTEQQAMTEKAAPEAAVRHPPKKPRVTRRSLLAGGAAMAASVAVGVGIDRAILTPGTGRPKNDMPLVTRGTPFEWHFVTTLEQLGSQAVRFVTDAVIGFVIFNDGDEGQDDPDKGKVVAFSAACTHMGCIVNWESSDRKFHCPCHGGVFTEYGKTASWGSPIVYAPLPRLETKVEDGKIYVKVPTSHK